MMPMQPPPGWPSHVPYPQQNQPQPGWPAAPQQPGGSLPMPFGGQNQDINADVGSMIAGAQVFGASENIRHGRYKFVIREISARVIEGKQGRHRWAFVIVTPMESAPNPQTEGDHVDYPGTAGPLKDDGMNPNPVGSVCAMKVDFDGLAGRVAGSNIKSFILGLFNKAASEISDQDVYRTWLDLSLQRDLRKGECYPGTNIPADTDKRANPACGMVIACATMPHKKGKANERGAYVTKLLWQCISVPGAGENTAELVAKRRAEIEAAKEEEDFAEPQQAMPTQPMMGQQPMQAPMQAPANPYAMPQQQPYAAPQTSFAQPAPAAMPGAMPGYAPSQPLASPAAMPTAQMGGMPQPTPPAVPAAAAPAVFVPPAPWREHPSVPKGATPETRWYWDGGTQVKNEAQLRAGL